MRSVDELVWKLHCGSIISTLIMNPIKNKSKYRICRVGQERVGQARVGQARVGQERVGEERVEQVTMHW